MTEAFGGNRLSGGERMRDDVMLAYTSNIGGLGLFLGPRTPGGFLEGPVSNRVQTSESIPSSRRTIEKTSGGWRKRGVIII